MDYEYRHSRRLIPLVVIQVQLESSKNKSVGSKFCINTISYFQLFQTADFLDAYGLQTEGIFRYDDKDDGLNVFCPLHISMA